MQSTCHGAFGTRAPRSCAEGRTPSTSACSTAAGPRRQGKPHAFTTAPVGVRRRIRARGDTTRAGARRSIASGRRPHSSACSPPQVDWVRIRGGAAVPVGPVRMERVVDEVVMLQHAHLRIPGMRRLQLVLVQRTQIRDCARRRGWLTYMALPTPAPFASTHSSAVARRQPSCSVGFSRHTAASVRALVETKSAELAPGPESVPADRLDQLVP